MKAPWRRWLDIMIQTCLGRQDFNGVLGKQGDVLGFNAGFWGPVNPNSGGAIGLDIVFRPGGVAGGNVFVTATAAQAEANTTQGPVHVAVDDSIAPASLDPGQIWDLGGRVQLDDGSPSGNAVLNVPAGTQLRNSPGGSLLALRCTPTLALPSLAWDGTARTLRALDGWSIINGPGAVGPIGVVGSVATPCTLFLVGVEAGFISAIGNEVFSLPAGSALFADCDACSLQPPTAFLAGAGLCFFAPAASGNAVPVADVNFTGSLIISLQDGPNLESVKTVTDAGAGITYTIDSTYLLGGHADQAIWCNPRAGTVTRLNLPDARLPMNKGRVIPIIDGNGVSEGSPIQLVATAPNPLNGVVGGTSFLSSARAQWAVRCDGTQWDVVQMPAVSGGSALTQTAWFIDPQNSSGLASDANTGLTALTPLRTIAELSRRWGGTQPNFASSAFLTTTTFLSATNATDPLNWEPETGTILVVFPLTNVQMGSFTAFTPRVQSPPSKANGTTGSFASWVPFLNMWVQDTTTASWFRVVADNGGGNATFTQPAVDTRSVTGNVVLPTLVAPGGADNFTIWQPTVCHVTEAGPLSTNARLVIQNALYTPVTVGGQCDFLGETLHQQCISNAYFVASSTSNEAAVGNDFSGKPSFTNSHLLAGCDLYDHFFMGGSIVGPFVLRAEGSQALHGGGMYLDGTAAQTPQSFTGGGRTQIGDVGIFCSSLNLLGGGQGRQTVGTISSGTDPTPGAVAAIWGTTGWPMKSAGIHMCKVSFQAELKVTGPITLCGLATASSWNPATGTYSVQTGVGSVSLAAAVNIDAAGAYAPGNLAAMFKEA